MILVVSEWQVMEVMIGSGVVVVLVVLVVGIEVEGESN